MKIESRVCDEARDYRESAKRLRRLTWELDVEFADRLDAIREAIRHPPASRAETDR